MTEPKRKIALMRPLLPEHKFIAPYLDEIDKNRWYSNFGPLVTALERRMEKFFEMDEMTVTTVANGTAGLTNALRAMELPKGSFCLVPSWTFMATPASAIAAGLVPFFLDVNPESWALEPEEVKKCIRKVPGMISALIVVSPFGAPIETAKWDAFTFETGIPVIIDGAAAFDSISTVEWAKPGKTPIMISLHATKVLGIGEGGIIISSNKKLIYRIQELINFGFNERREINVPGTNAKMSEYSAAVGMAALDLWPQKRGVWTSLKFHYIEAFRRNFSGQISSPWMLSNEWVSSVCNIKLPARNAVQTIESLAKRGIEAKRWWTDGCHHHPAYAKFPRLDLSITEELGESVIGLPFTIDMKSADIDYVMENLAEIISAEAPGKKAV